MCKQVAYSHQACVLREISLLIPIRNVLIPTAHNTSPVKSLVPSINVWEENVNAIVIWQMLPWQAGHYRYLNISAKNYWKNKIHSHFVFFFFIPSTLWSKWNQRRWQNNPATSLQDRSMDCSCHHGLLPLGSKHPFGESSHCCFQVSDTLQSIDLGRMHIVHSLWRLLSFGWETFSDDVRGRGKEACLQETREMPSFSHCAHFQVQTPNGNQGKEAK